MLEQGRLLSLPVFKLPTHHLCALRISMPRQKLHAAAEEEDGGASMKNCLSTDQLEVDLDASSDVSSELSFGYEFAQAEVMMKGMGTDGESLRRRNATRSGIPRH